MGKLNARVISFGRYRFTDMFLFAVILVAFELISFFAFTSWFSDYADFIFSIVVPVTLLMMLRWGWYGMFYAVFDGLFYCMLVLLNWDGVTGTEVWQYLLIYGIGNAFIGLDYLMVHFVGYKRIQKRWWLTLLFTLAGWLCIALGRTAVAACVGLGFTTDFLIWDLLSLAMALVIMFIMRRSDGMMERQKDYLLRLQKEKEERWRIDTYGDDPIEISPEDIEALNKKGNDLFE
ncbi:MAG: hypothetical protein LUD19_06690 [Clostridia bacterium]|nr:hypothetical protein [Clostridia bacterium]